ncbi:MAG: SRPBCC family protein [Bacteroidota bacterium]|nr:SRPBCC family protein [Bacteroidota bacterium]
MMVNKLFYSQKLPISLDDAWDFLSSPNNLKLITPESMNFKIIDWDKKKAYPGQIIQYTVSPVFGMKIKWVTEITQVKRNSYFIDEQRFGPYSFWHHKHFIKEIDNGILMDDIIHYKIPFGFIGEILNKVYVQNKLKKIFKYRENKLNEIFGNYTD